MELAPVPAVGHGEHACGVFGSDDGQARMVAGFARDAVGRGDRLLYLTDRSDDRTVLSFVDEGGLDASACRDDGTLQIVHSSELGWEDGFDAERQLARWGELIASARADGHSGLAVTAEMSWALTWKLDPSALVDYEVGAATIFENGQFSALCQYDRRVFDSELLARVKQAHPLRVELDPTSSRVEVERLRLDRRGDVIELTGEIDIANADVLQTQLAHGLARGDLRADCSGVEFIDLSGCRVLRRAAQGKLGPGRLELVDAPPLFARVMALCDLADGADL